jgi:predicted Zn-ribbon and HTH transcriptional regulator
MRDSGATAPVPAISVAKDASQKHPVATGYRKISSTHYHWFMARVPITVMGYRCERCGHEWIPRGTDEEPRVCPKCRSAWWNRPRKSMMTYDDFRLKIVAVLQEARHPLTWTEIRTVTGLPQLFPNNQWVHRLERDIGLQRNRDPGGIIHWQITDAVAEAASPQTPEAPRSRPRRK